VSGVKQKAEVEEGARSRWRSLGKNLPCFNQSQQKGKKYSSVQVSTRSDGKKLRRINEV